MMDEQKGVVMRSIAAKPADAPTLLKPSRRRSFGWFRPVKSEDATLSEAWGLIDTQVEGRKELVEVADGDKTGHIATIQMGQSMNLERFQLALVLIRLAPSMCLLLAATLEYLQSPEGETKEQRKGEIIEAISTVLSKVSSPYEQGEA